MPGTTDSLGSKSYAGLGVGRSRLAFPNSASPKPDATSREIPVNFTRRRLLITTAGLAVAATGLSACNASAGQEAGAAADGSR